MQKVNVDQIGDILLNNPKFINGLRTNLWDSESLASISSKNIQKIVDQISQILDHLISQKLRIQFNQLIAENNQILIDIRQNLQKQYKQEQDSNRSVDSKNSNLSFCQIKKLIDQEKKKFDENDGQLQTSMSVLVDMKFETIQTKLISTQGRLRSLEQKFDTNTKGIWNVLSITQSAIFDHIKKCDKSFKNLNKVDPVKSQNKFFNLW